VDRSYFCNDFLPRWDVNKFDAILSGICGIIEAEYVTYFGTNIELLL
jgi:hypothetical protein